MVIYQLARRVNARLKQYRKNRAGKVLSPVRRIERICPPVSGRYVAMTFDDGPCAYSFSQSEQGLTQCLLDTLQQFGATVSFDVIGSTADNYPDTEGEHGAFTWSGVRFDHYPKFGSDSLAGVFNQPGLTKQILDAGHELTNHGGSHRLFGPMRAVYGSRTHFQNLHEVVEDLNKLHSCVQEQFGYEMKLSRPPHYIDRIPDGTTSYDAYRIMGYNYMAASFDGAGWLPCSSYAEEVEAMVRPLQDALQADPDALNGQIIFQKDGCNMDLRAPIADALPRQLKLLQDYGYQVVPVSGLLALAPFEDLPENDPAMPYVRTMLDAGHIVGYQNNTFHGERPITEKEFWLMAAKPELIRTPGKLDVNAVIQQTKASFGNLPTGAMTGNQLLDIAMKTGVSVEESLFQDKKLVKRKDAVQLLAGMIGSSCV